MLSNQEIKAIADKIAKLNLSVPCAFLLEAHIPLSGIIHNLSLAGAPFLYSFKGYQNLSNFFAERENLEKLLEELHKNS